MMATSVCSVQSASTVVEALLLRPIVHNAQTTAPLVKKALNYSVIAVSAPQHVFYDRKKDM
jgi:hypothetical protein